MVTGSRACVALVSRLQLAIDKTATNTRLPRVKLHRGRAILSKDRKHITPATSECLFVQGARALNAKPSTYLRATLDEQKECVAVVLPSCAARGCWSVDLC